MVKIFHDIVIVLNAQNIEKSVGGFEFSPRAAKPQMGKIKFPMSHERLIFIPMQVKNFPMNGSAGVVKKNSTTSGEAARGGIFFYHNCWAMNGEIFDAHGNENEPWVTNREFYQDTISLCRSISFQYKGENLAKPFKNEYLTSNREMNLFYTISL